MKKNLSMLLCLLLVVVCALASCGGGKKDDHEHSFDAGWETNATHHWHAAICEHGEIKDSEAQHTDANEDGLCDVCEHEIGHDHTYETEWTYDETHHWYKATCTHLDVKGSNTLHLDEDVNGSCDVCLGHVHNVNPAGYCTIASCGEKVREIDETNLDDLVNAVYFQNYLVNGGTVDYLFEGKSNTSESYNASSHEFVNYIFGKNNYTYSKVESESTNAGVTASSTLETWHQLRGNEETFGVYSEDGGVLSLDVSNVDRLKGYYISLSTLSGEYGTAETLYALYLNASDQNEDGSLIGDVEVIIGEEENKVTFKYEYKTVFVNHTDVTTQEGRDEVYNVNYFIVEVSFCYNDDFALTELWINCDCYTNDPGTSQTDGFLTDDVDLDYDPATGSFTLRENALADTYTIYCTQTVGARDEENPNPSSKFVPTGFNIYLTQEPTYDEEGLENGYQLVNRLSGTIDAKVGDIVNLYLSDYTPTSASLHFIADQVTYKLFRNDVEVPNPDDYLNQTAIAIFTFSGSLRSFFVIPKEDGAYRLEIYVMGELMKQVNINAGVVDEDYIEYDPTKEFLAKVTEAYEWTNEVSFTATKTGTYYFYLPVGFGLVDADAYDAAESTPETDDGPAPYYDFQSLDNRNPDGSYKAGSVVLTLTEGQTIRFYANAAGRDTYIITYYCF